MKVPRSAQWLLYRSIHRSSSPILWSIQGPQKPSYEIPIGLLGSKTMENKTIRRGQQEDKGTKATRDISYKTEDYMDF